MDEKFHIFDRIILINSQYLNLHGEIKFIGAVAGSQGVWYGIELDVN